MLLLTRKIGESILIGDDIVVTIVELRGNQIKVGIDAPKEVSIVRPEIAGKYDKDGNQIRKGWPHD